jgi:hypothetical protein
MAAWPIGGPNVRNRPRGAMRVRPSNRPKPVEESGLAGHASSGGRFRRRCLTSRGRWFEPITAHSGLCSHARTAWLSEAGGASRAVRATRCCPGAVPAQQPDDRRYGAPGPTCPTCPPAPADDEDAPGAVIELHPALADALEASSGHARTATSRRASSPTRAPTRCERRSRRPAGRRRCRCGARTTCATGASRSCTCAACRGADR